MAVALTAGINVATTTVVGAPYQSSVDLLGREVYDRSLWSVFTTVVGELVVLSLLVPHMAGCEGFLCAV